MREIAETLIASAAVEGCVGSAALSASIHELRPSLLIFMGQGGFRALVARALFLVSRKFPELGAVRANNDGSFAGLDEACATLGDPDIREARISLLTEVLLLLVQFLGSGVTLAVISDAWPNALGHVDLRLAERS